ncbi:MAG: UvrD-helicase domain-containing protein [Acidobacteria bacterium]|nr:UvrD-helicase domain-containing protein [Acidobacteriota bacterium]
MSAMSDARLPFDEPSPVASADADARVRAVDPRFNVALEASAGTGKTRVLVDRYVNLLRAGVDPSNILAITFTRKAATEMRERIMTTLRAAGERGEIPAARWRELRDRTADIAISTIDAFCLSLLREFPLEADLDPAFSIADETELPRLIDEALDGALRICRAAAQEDETVALAFSQLGERRARAALTSLLSRRLVAPEILARYLDTARAVELDAATVCTRASHALLDACEAMRGGLDRLLETGPLEPRFDLLARGLRRLRHSVDEKQPLQPSTVQTVFSRVRDHFLTQDGDARSRSPYARNTFASEADWRTHRDLVVGHAAAILRVSDEFRRELNVLVSRGIWRMFRIAETEYRRTLDAHAVLDFSDLLLKTLDLLRRMEDFARSRYRLESRYHHVLVDEFQDTSRAQWQLVSLLVQSWGEGAGLADSGPLQPSVFIVGDRKQSIYGFRDADVSVLREAAGYLDGLRPGGDVRRTITRSFRATAPLLAFVNDLCTDLGKAPARADAFGYDETDRFPVDDWASKGQETLGLVLADSPESCAEITAAEIARLLASGATVRDRDTGVPRAIRQGDVGILFRTRESHREFEAALERHHIRSYVYKGLGFFDADEIKDVLALVWYLADPASDLRAAALMRSRIFGVSDEALRLLSPGLSGALRAPSIPPAAAHLTADDSRALVEARESTRRWLDLVDRIPPAELVDLALTETAYAYELRGARLPQARENLKKIRSLLRRMQNRGYATLSRLAAHLDRLAVGDESNATVDALDAVNLMTVHAAKGLEFPVVFVVNLARGSGNRRDPVRVVADAPGVSGGVSVGDFQSEADEDRPAREREETKRLLYVALTRARDRLYLGTVLKDGRVQPGRGSLAEVIPQSLLDRMIPAGDEIEWTATSSQRVHCFRVCRVGEAGGLTQVLENASVPGESSEGQPHDFALLIDDAVPTRSVAGVLDQRMATGFRSDLVESSASSRLVGTLVHRLLHRIGLAGMAEADVTPDTVVRLLRSEEFSAVAEDRTVAELANEVVAAHQAISCRPDVRAVYFAGERWHEVPFSTRAEDGSVMRGTIDCVIRDPEGRVTVLEFKTGSPRDEHRAQLDLYKLAAERLFPGSPIDVRLVYASQNTLS